MRTLVFDTETNGFDDPHIVQLACIIVDGDKEVSSLNVIIKPDGWEVPDKVAEIHGITTELAHRHGIPIYAALWLFDELCGQADLVVAHNLAFDFRVTQGEYKRLGKVWTPKATFCTMNATTNLCKIPKARGSGWKWPKLIEAHQHFFGEGFDGAHDALVDVRACARLHRHLLDNDLI